MTASQPELQLMLLDGALRFGRLAQAAWTDDAQSLEASRQILRMMDVVEELVRSVSGKSVDVASRLEEEYAFIFRSLAELYLKGTQDQLDAVLRLLAYQRETWQLICEKFRSDLGGPTLDRRSGPAPRTDAARPNPAYAQTDSPGRLSFNA